MHPRHNVPKAERIGAAAAEWCACDDDESCESLPLLLLLSVNEASSRTWWLSAGTVVVRKMPTSSSGPSTNKLMARTPRSAPMGPHEIGGLVLFLVLSETNFRIPVQL